MARPFSLVHLDGSPPMTGRLTSLLREWGTACEILPVPAGALNDALARQAVDLLVCGPHPAQGDLPGLVRTARAAAPDIPVLVVLDAEHDAAELALLHAGAGDCVSLSRPGRLGWSVPALIARREDVTRLERLQHELDSVNAQLRHAQRLTNVARLAAGVAHDFNNLLTVINGCCQLLLHALPEDDARRQLLEPIEQAGTRGAELAKRLLSFSRPAAPSRAPLSLNRVVSDLQPMLAALLGERVQVALNLEPSLWGVRADAAELSQVLMNLVTNARDAMPEGGTIVIRTANLDRLHGGSSPPGGAFVELVVRDAGCGMTEEVRAKIFDPFFTTKSDGEGTGLGLATVRRIVAELGGDIDVETAPGRGTTMRMRLPRADGAEPGAPYEARQSAAPASGFETVLVVEDEAAVRRVIAAFLRSAGYRVLEAADPESAQTHCQRERGSIDLLVSDVVLPGLSGPTMAEGLREQQPGLKTLFISGYPAEAISQTGAMSAPAFLPKPFSREALLQYVRRALASS